ncbi:hypothetical protein A11A3_14967 [Alcanivorax hongdengensis A-11-3]|uniref:GXWXG domain-containing protein n=1 Tax=Alcanivorax hongdengensis A-11-3 TaxID=1177179 RepID=L0W889_9GAMM|nr:DUF4334 domain-containing protein [Alcanivorax hongdengensis]EKF73184.1 hypothetical protein A11A3_14967 [Alcanivorax hongdengensis A-11-3]
MSRPQKQSNVHTLREVSFAAAQTQGQVSLDEALTIFDALEPVQPDFMIGAWQGEGFETGHPLDGVLERCHWHGKRFESAEHVHPLVFRKAGGKLASVKPLLTMPALGLLDRLPMLKSARAGKVFQWLIPLLSTGNSDARLRMTSYRGKVSATMVYDNLPINDVFRKVDDNTVLGVMDMKGMKTPFFFVLRREDGSA